MGRYINLGNAGFKQARNGEYVDKSGLIAIINKTLNTEAQYTCVSRSRRFGKSMAAKMLCAYYDRSCDSRSLFTDLEIANDPHFEKHLNKYPVIYLDLSEFITYFNNPNLVEFMDDELKKDIQEAYPNVPVPEGGNLMDTLIRVSQATNDTFIFIIDEWDAICREFRPGTNVMDEYLNWFRSMFKGVNASRVFAAVYMTGILPIKIYNTQSALNNFWEYSVIIPRKLAKYFGFTKDEVKCLAKKHGMDFDELVKWYDGYKIGDEPSMFNPSSVMQALNNGKCESFWAATGAYDAIANYIKMDYEGLRADIIDMLAGGRCSVKVQGFKNDLNEIRSRNDVLTALIHLGYLSYDGDAKQCYIPNREVADEMENAIELNNWRNVIDALETSDRLLKALLQGKAEIVAAGVEKVHRDNISLFKYNDENSLACVIGLAFYTARNDFHVHREYPTGDGYADMVLIPRKNVNKPAIVIELKYDKTTDTAISQIKNRHYPDKLAQYSGELLLVGINYDTDTKSLTCFIESLLISH